LENDALLFANWGSDSDEEPDEKDERPVQPDNNETPESRIASLQQENKILQSQLLEAQNAMQTMAQTMSRIVSDARLSDAKNSKQVPDTEAKLMLSRRQDAEDLYFGGYSTRRIHELMLRDTARTCAYRDFMYNNKDLFRDKVVLDIGCGSGILSMFAARAGARQVIGIDMADIIDKARIIVENNNLSDKITLIKSKAEEAVLPVQQVDIIISEWMGYFLLFESMLPSVLFARDRYLAPGGHVFPTQATMFLAGAELCEMRDYSVGFWGDVYGFNMNELLDPTEVHPGTICRDIKMEKLITDTVQLQSFDMLAVQDAELDFKQDFSLQILRTHTLSAFVVWFDTLFDAKDCSPVNLSTGPLGVIGETERIGTHWKQSLFFLHEPLEVKQGAVITGILTATRKQVCRREYDVTISYQVTTDSVASQRFFQEFSLLQEP
jgi:protein arginine N-methyltransferase 1